MAVAVTDPFYRDRRRIEDEERVRAEHEKRQAETLRASRNEYVKHHAPRILEAMVTGRIDGIDAASRDRVSNHAIALAVAMHDAVVAFQGGKGAP